MGLRLSLLLKIEGWIKLNGCFVVCSSFTFEVLDFSVMVGLHCL